MPSFLGSRQAPPRPDVPVYAVGDIHGCADLLEEMLHRLAAHIVDSDSGDARIVFLGDHIDRGPESAAVLERLADLATSEPDHVVCLRGNHEQMLLDFLDDASAGPRWLKNGGRETLMSFGLPPLSHDAVRETLEDVRVAFRQALPDGMEDWLRGLPLTMRSGDLWAVHAGADPSRGMEAQVPQNLIWGHADFARRPHRDGIWIVHGHTVVSRPRAEGGRISVDTGAYRSGQLSAAAILPGKAVEFLTVTE